MKPGNGDEARRDVVVLAVVREVQAVAVDFQAFGRSRVVIAVAPVAGTEGVKICFTTQIQIAGNS